MAACIRGPRSVQDPVDSLHKSNNVQYKSIIQVYTDWANHYLEKARCRKMISDLQQDMRDGVLLADLIEAVTGQKAADLHRRPKTSSQMTENVKACLTLLSRLGVALDGITAKDVRDGNLKAILGLFFALSKHKQQQKQQTQQQLVERDKQQKLIGQNMNSRLPSPFHGGAGSGAGGTPTSIPTPVLRPPAAVPVGGSPLKCTSASSSRSTSPSHSFIPTPRSRSSLNDKQHTSGGHTAVVRVSGSVGSPYASSSNKNSNLDKIKLYNPSDKIKPALGNTKRTSSSSGFSSARSERSDSSTSLYNDIKSSVPEKKDLGQNDLSLKPGLRKKVIKVSGDSKVTRVPNKPSMTKLVQPVVRTVSEIQPAIPETQDDNSQEAEDKMKAPEPPKSSPTGGSGIPKPMAAVKGTAKPTHSVAPMPQITADKENPEVNHVKQQSVGEEEENTETVKPMQPLLRGYKSNIALTPRPLPVDHSGWRTVTQSPADRGPGDGDYVTTYSSSGYMSDGDILNRTSAIEVNDGYISEGGAHRAQERLHRGPPLPVELNRSAKPLARLQREGKTEGARSDELKILSTDEVHHYKRGSAPGPEGSGRGEGFDPPLSPPEPQPVVYRVVGSRSHIKKADSSQQTENSAFRQVSSSQWKKYVEGVPELSRHDVGRKQKQQPYNGLQRKPDKKRISGSKEELAPEEYTNGDRKGRESKSKVRGVPPNFGYIKRSINGNGKGEPRTAQVSAVPRTKVKVSGGTQTDLKAYSVGGTSGAQLSASVRERLLQGSQSLPKARTDTGSLSDSNYTELSPYSAMYRHTTAAAYTASLPARVTAAGLIEADSIESLPAQLHHRASLTHPRLMSPSPSPSASNRLSRSNSIRSTKSEKLYPSMLQRSEEMDPYYSIPYSMGPGSQHSSQPTSPTPSQMSQGTLSRFNYPISPISASPSSHMISRTYPYSGLMSKMNSKDDDVHGSAVSLVSTASSLYSTPEEKQAHEMRKLRRELGEAQEKVHTLTNQLSTNAHVVSAFEQSLSNMTQRLQQLTATAEKKDSELLELRQTIELLRKQSVEAGLTSQNLSPSLARRHTINTATDSAAGSNIARQLSTDSVSSLNSLSSACSLSSAAHTTDADKKKKRGWLRSSFNKAFSRTKKNRTGSVSDAEDSKGMSSDLSAPSSPLLGTAHHINGDEHGNLDSQPSSVGYDRDAVVDELRKQLREKDLVLTDIRLEALSSAHQLESLKDTVIKMRNEMLNLKQDNERLQRIVTSKSLTSSQSSLPLNEVERRFSMGDAITPGTDERTSLFAEDPDGKRVLVSVYLGSHGSYHKYVEEGAATCPIAAISVSGKTKWDMLDAMVRRAFKDYCERLDPLSSLGGLGVDCIWSYHIGEVVRYKDSNLPDLLPCGYLVGETCNITVCLKGALHNGSVDALVFETLIPKSIVQRYISLLNDHRRIILCGPSGTGKSYLANKLAEFLVLRAGKDSTAEAIATFNVDHKSNKELRGYLTHVAEQCEHNASELPSVIILDGLQHAAEVFTGLLSAKHATCPYIIGTMNQATCATTNLQLHHNFRWVLCANHMEPVKGLLARCLTRRLVETECRAGMRDSDLMRVVDWLPRVWHHLNQFLETHSSSDVTIGPRLFLACPMDVAGSQVWFTDLWNYSVVPYLLEAVREGLQLYGCRAPWDDPTIYICQTYPWIGEAVHGGSDALIRLRPEDVGYDTTERDGGGVGSSIKSLSSTQSDTDADPLLNMLMRLQEAANYSSPHGTEPSRSDDPGIESTI
ncbi:protein sickie isoform X3 [Homalodisca vitripennis]|uniref:protein sickie isoform X3 n=1 Tax=Homalodisca vitripennis TaxID=197043 RepID=UPI001EEA7074|nr:protein sickie isoform X3 [Homalodisca vitripennis]